MENAKKVALITMAVVIVYLASSCLAASDALEAHTRKLASIMEAAPLIGRHGENSISKGRPYGLFDPHCGHLYCTSKI